MPVVDESRGSRGNFDNAPEDGGYGYVSGRHGEAVDAVGLGNLDGFSVLCNAGKTDQPAAIAGSDGNGDGVEREDSLRRVKRAVFAGDRGDGVGYRLREGRAVQRVRRRDVVCVVDGAVGEGLTFCDLYGHEGSVAVDPDEIVGAGTAQGDA